MSQAAAKHGVTRQRIHQIVVANKIPRREMLFYKMVPDPFPFHIVKRNK